MLSNTTYNDYTVDDEYGYVGAGAGVGAGGGVGVGVGVEAVFYPDAPSYPPIAPVKPRATPYVSDPDECTINFRTGTIKCLNTQSHGQLNARPIVMPPMPMSNVMPMPMQMQMPGMPMGPMGFQPAAPVQLPPYPNYVYGGSVVAEPPDSPLNRILQRAPAGPWKLVGAAIAAHAHDTAPRDRTMLVYAQMVDSGRDRYNYRVVDPNSVPLDIDQKVHWKDNGDRLFIPGYPGEYILQLYYNYR
jgi:hypothetical protein